MFRFKDINIRNKFQWIVINICLILSITMIYGLYNSKTIFQKILLMEIDPIKALIFILLIIILYYASILIHEVGHYVVLKALGYKVRLIVVGPIIYTKNNNSHSLKCNRSGVLILGGCVIPKINDIIYDETSLDKCVKQYIKILYGGIFGTIALIILSSVFIVVNQHTFINMCILIINWPILINAFKNNNLVFGDYCLIELLKSEPDYLVSCFLNNLDIEYPLNAFIKEKMAQLLDYVLIKKEYNELMLSLTEKILDEYIIEGKKLSDAMESFKSWVFDNYEQINGTNMNLRIVIIKASYKFLLHEYSLGKYKEFLSDYKKFEKFLLKYRSMMGYDYIKRLVNTLKTLEEKGEFEIFDARYVISDLEGLLKDCENYKRRTDLIINKLMHL